MVVKSTCKMKNGNASGPSGVVTEMLKVSYNICSELIADLTNSIVCENMMPSEWDGSFLLSSFNGNSETIDRIYCHSLKLTEHVLNVVKQIIEVIIRDVVNVDDMQFGSMSVPGTTYTIFILQ